MNLQELIEKRINAFQADIAAGTFPTTEDFDREMSRVSNIIIATAVGKGMRMGEVQEQLNKKFVPTMKHFYQKRPENYFFASAESKIESFLKDGRIEDARGTLADVTEMLRNRNLVNDAFAAGTFTPEEVKYFGKVSMPELEEQITRAEIAREMQKEQPIKKFSLSKQNPYNGQTVGIIGSLKSLGGKIQEKFKKHKVKVCGGVLAAALLATGLGIERNLH